ncbi:MAG: D-alanyl-D-alanine endopeptidase, partial [Solimonas sp.]
ASVLASSAQPAAPGSGASAIAALPQLAPSSRQAADEAAAVQAPAVIETPDEDIVESITQQIEKKPEKKKLTLPTGLRLKSSVVLVVDQNTQEVLAAQNPDEVQPIASLTKLMTALVVSEAKLPLDETIEITRDDIDQEKHTYSRLSPGLKFTREELLLLALMSSENRAASALGRSYPGGRQAFIRAMNAKAQALGMAHTHYDDSSGLSSHNVSTAADLVKLVNAAYKVPLIREFSTQTEHTVKPGRRTMHFVSSNRLVRAKNDWRIGLQKTGFTNEAGRCLVMQATVKGRPLVMVLLDSDGKFTRFADAQRVRSWVEGDNSKGKTTASSKSSRRARARSAS